MKSSVIIFPGSNCDKDIQLALEKSKFNNNMIWHNESLLPKTDLVVLPGGFSYGDYLRTGCIAAKSKIIGEVIKLAKERKQTVFPVQNRWYGFDPVHVLRRYHRQMWSEILLRWRPDQPLLELGRSSLAESLYLVTLPPRERKIFGFSRWRVQPSGVLSDGSTISLY